MVGKFTEDKICPHCNRVQQDRQIQKLEAELFNLRQHYEIVYGNYCDLADFLAFKLGYKDTDDAMEEFKQWLVQE